MHRKLVWASALLLVPASSARAETQCHVAVVPVSVTNWGTVLSIPRFDPSLGLLREVRVTLNGSIAGSMGIENFGPAQVSLSMTLAANVTVLEPGGAATLLTTGVSSPPYPLTLAGYDGVTDFGGTSGASIQGIVATGSSNVVLPHPSGSAALFVGPPYQPGNVLVPIGAVGTSYISGNLGNEVAFFQTSAGANLEVCYVYDLDCNGNGVADSQDITAGTSLDANANGVPDECDYAFFPGLCPGDGSGNACPCGNTSTPGGRAGCANSTGNGGFLAASGVARISADTLLLTSNGLPASTTSLFFQGTSSVNSDLGVAFGDGLRCAGGAIRRLGTRTAQAGVASFPPSGGPGVATTGAVTPGLRVYQVWYRNAASFCTASTFNLTNGVGVIWGV